MLNLLSAICWHVYHVRSRSRISIRGVLFVQMHSKHTQKIEAMPTMLKPCPFSCIFASGQSQLQQLWWLISGSQILPRWVKAPLSTILLVSILVREEFYSGQKSVPDQARRAHRMCSLRCPGGFVWTPRTSSGSAPACCFPACPCSLTFKTIFWRVSLATCRRSTDYKFVVYQYRILLGPCNHH